MGNRVAIVGIGLVNNPGMAHINKNFKQLLVESSYKAIKDANININDIEGASFSYAGESEIGHGGITPTLVDALGLAPIPAFINCSNCASGHTAFLQGYDMVKSGKYTTVLVAGFDKTTDVLPFQDYMLLSSDSMYDYNFGYSHIDSVLLQVDYFRENNIPSDVQKSALMKFTKLAYENGQKNPAAVSYNKPIPTDQMLLQMPFFGSLMTTGEGSAAMILTTEENAKKLKDDPVFVESTSYVTTSHYVGHRYDPSLIRGIDSNVKGGAGNGIPLEIACKNAYKEAGIGPKDIDTLQVYDQGVNEFVSLEASGICKKGEAPEFILSGKGDIDGECPVNTDGGNIGRGFAGGTAGIYPLIEIVEQLRGKAKGAQIPRPIKYGLSTFVGGGFAHSIAVIMSNKK